MKRTLQRLLLVVAAAAVVVGVGGWWWHSRDGARLPLATTAVKRGEVTATISATGTIEPLEVVDVGAQIAGRVAAFGKDNLAVDILTSSCYI